MAKRSEHINNWLLPVSWMYGFGVFFRRKLFEWNILKRKSYNIPVICVGNITVGGTGKTPHVEYLIRLLQHSHRVAVLSRGYKRKTKGFILANEKTTYQEIGDEPYQIKNKFPDIIVAVDENRVRGIDKLLSMKDKPDIILLDDAYQHLYVKPSYSILLIDYNRPIYNDALLPAGRLREGSHNMDRANIVIMTKCPPELKPIDLRIITHELNVFPYQILLFTTIEYGNLISMFGHTDLFNKEEKSLDFLYGKKVLLLTGIASPKTIIDEVKKYSSPVEILTYPDHHNYASSDIKDIEGAYHKLNDKEVITVVTEKDAMRLIHRNDLGEEFKRSLYYLPIRIKFINPEDQAIFNKEIYKHVRKNSRDSGFYKE